MNGMRARLWCFVVLALGCGSAMATNAVVSSCNETAFNSAFNTVNGSGSGTITFTCSGTIVFSAYKQVSGDVVIDGGGAVTFDGGGTSPFFQVFNGHALTLKRLTVQNGAYNGVHPLEVFGSLTLESVTVKNHSVTASVVYNSFGTITVTASTFSGNHIVGGTAWAGAGLRNDGGTVVVSGSTFSNNGIDSVSQGNGGAINNESSGSLYISNSTFTSNHAFDGGAIQGDSGTIHIAHSTFTSNTAAYGGAIENFGSSLTLNYDKFNTNSASNLGGALWGEGGNTFVNWSEFTGNAAVTTGGAIHCDGTNLYVDSSTFSANKSDQITPTNFANHGGAIYSGCYTSITRSTFYNNSAPAAEGGAIYFGGNMFAGLYYSTLVANLAQEGAAIGSSNGFAGGLRVAQLILSGNTHGHSCSGGPTTSSGYSLADDMACGGFFGAVTDQPNVTLAMGAFTNNGGPTRTVAPASGNPAINYIPAADPGCTFPTTDQRGALRGPSPPGGKCDSGAVEVGGIIDLIFKDGFELP